MVDNTYEHGFWQDLPCEPPDYEAMRRDLAEMTSEERIEAALNYIKARYVTNSHAYGVRPHRYMTPDELRRKEATEEMFSRGWLQEWTGRWVDE